MPSGVQPLLSEGTASAHCPFQAAHSSISWTREGKQTMLDVAVAAVGQSGLSLTLQAPAPIHTARWKAGEVACGYEWDRSVASNSTRTAICGLSIEPIHQSSNLILPEIC